MAIRLRVCCAATLFALTFPTALFAEDAIGVGTGFLHGFVVRVLTEEADARSVIDAIAARYGQRLDDTRDFGAASEGTRAWGALYDAYRVYGIPQAVLVDAKGQVAAHGTLREMIGRAGTLPRPEPDDG
jgi:hypothetical protein